MTLPSSGPISWKDIALEIYGVVGADRSIKQMFVDAGISPPYNIDKFYGFTSAFIEVSPSAVNLPYVAPGGASVDTSVDVSTNIDWELDISSIDSTKFTFGVDLFIDPIDGSAGNTLVRIIALEDETSGDPASPRSTVITFTAGSAEDTVRLCQDGSDRACDPI